MIFKTSHGLDYFRRFCVCAVGILSVFAASNGEAQNREGLCRLELPDLQVFGEHFANLGQTRVAYDLASKLRATSSKDCGCTAEWPFDAFLEGQLGVRADELTQSNIRDLRDWSDDEGVTILRDYRAFRALECAE